MNRSKLWLLVGIFSCLPAVVMAHGSADNHLQIVVMERTLKLNISVGMEVLSRCDANDDGSVSLGELDQERTALETWLSTVLLISNENAQAPTQVFSDITSDLDLAAAHSNRIEYARVIRTFEFAEKPRALRIDLRSLAELLPTLKVTIIDAASGKKYRVRNPGARQSIVLPAPDPLPGAQSAKHNADTTRF